MAKNKGNEYFEAFIGMSEYALTAARELNRLFCNFKANELESAIEPLHITEHEADMLMHRTMEKLIHEFITPIENEDISGMLSQLDTVVDNVEDVAIKAYMYNLKAIRAEGIEFCDIIMKCMAALTQMMREFSSFKKSKHIKDFIVEINDLEETADGIYKRAMHRLYAERADAVEVLVWTQMFDALERCCDDCEHIAYCVETTILKNS